MGVPHEIQFIDCVVLLLLQRGESIRFETLNDWLEAHNVSIMIQTPIRSRATIINSIKRLRSARLITTAGKYILTEEGLSLARQLGNYKTIPLVLQVVGKNIVPGSEKYLQ